MATELVEVTWRRLSTTCCSVDDRQLQAHTSSLMQMICHDMACHTKEHAQQASNSQLYMIQSNA